MSEEKGKREKTYVAGKEMEDIEELRAVLSVLKDEVPPLIRGIVGPLRELLGLTLTEEQARERARAIAAMYKELVDAGMSKEDAMKIVESQTVNITALVRSVLQGVFREEARKGAPRSSKVPADEIAKEIEEQIRKAVRERLKEKLKRT